MSFLYLIKTPINIYLISNIKLLFTKQIKTPKEKKNQKPNEN